LLSSNRNNFIVIGLAILIDVVVLRNNKLDHGINLENTETTSQVLCRKCLDVKQLEHGRTLVNCGLFAGRKHDG
jgi:hypothetical protein